MLNFKLITTLGVFTRFVSYFLSLEFTMGFCNKSWEAWTG